MREIDVQTWPRRKHFETFSAFNHPHFNLCVNVDLTVFNPAVKERGLSFTVAIIYVICRASNDIPEFRCRIRGRKVVEHEIVNAGVTILASEDLFTFCTLDYVENFSQFAARAAERIAHVKEHPTLAIDPEKDDMLYMTALPWVAFTSFAHPMQLHPTDSIPRFAWGKAFEEGQLLKMPLSAQGHHALMDGIHIARFYDRVQGYLHHPGSFLGNA
jgi:chloramphenicol O-acetyltransferase type A